MNHMETEKQLRENKEKYQFFFEDSPEGNLVIKDGKFIDCNKSALNLFRLEKHELIGKSPSDFSPKIQPNGRPSDVYFWEIFESAQKQGVGQFEWVHCRQDGSEFLAEIKLSTISISGEEVVFTTWKDITEKRATEKALIQSEERYRQISEHTGSVIWELDLTGLFT